MPDFVKLNGTAVRTTGSYRRKIKHESGLSLDELELVIIVRGSMANKSLKLLLSQEPVRVDLPKAGEWETFAAAIEQVAVQSSGSGEAAAYRFDLTLRETPESAHAREVDRESQPVEESPVATYMRSSQRAESPEPQEISDLPISGDSAVWATALKQMKAGPGPRPPAPEPPLTPMERTGIEAILVNLRMDALIDQLEAAGRLQRGDVNRAFMSLVKERFISEATPVVGERVAKRAERDLLG